MKAIALTHYLPIDNPQSLEDVTLTKPAPPVGHDLLIRVQAVSVNPVDTKIRSPKPTVEPSPRILGYDAAGIVESIGEQVTAFAPGDMVYYAGDITRSGSNAQYQLVDERLIAHKPITLDFALAAALPLTAITAWELLFERMPYSPAPGSNTGKHLLILGGAGGVGSIATQLAARSGFTVIATASRERTRNWVTSFGATHVINHHEPIAPQLKALGLEELDVVLNLANTDQYWELVGEILKPLGHVGLIVEPAGALRIGDPYKAKCIGIHWEFMGARARFKTADMQQQGYILKQIAELIDAGELRSTLSEILSPINATNLREAHRRMESGSGIGKLVLSGWPT